jgi:hypothetical protein
VETPYPFPIPAKVIPRLPPPSRDGLIYVDVRFRAQWEGILVINELHQCIGIYATRKVFEYPLPFFPEEIEDVRSPRLINWALTFLPLGFDAYGTSLFAAWTVCPILFVVAFWWPVAALVLVPLAIAVIAGLYSINGFPFLRPLTAIFILNLVLWSIKPFFHSLQSIMR